MVTIIIVIKALKFQRYSLNGFNQNSSINNGIVCVFVFSQTATKDNDNWALLSCHQSYMRWIHSYINHKGSLENKISVKGGILSQLTQSQHFKTTTIQNGDFVGILSQYGRGSPDPTKANQHESHQKSPISKKWDFFMNKYYA